MITHHSIIGLVSPLVRAVHPVCLSLMFIYNWRYQQWVW